MTVTDRTPLEPSRLPGSGSRALVGAARRAEPAVLLAVGVLVALVAAAAVLAPRLMVRAERASLDRAIELASPADRQLAISIIDEFGTGRDDDPLATQRERLDTVSDQIDDSVLAQFGEPRLVVDTNRFEVADQGIRPDAAGDFPEIADPPALPTRLTFRIHPEIDDHSRLVEGRRAEPTDRRVGGVRVLEFELTPAAADELGWELGELVRFTTDTTDLVTRQFDRGLPPDFAAELVGLRELDRVDDPYWFDDPRLHRPTIADTSIGASVFAFATIHADQLPTRPFQVDGTSPFSLEERRDLVPGALTLDQVDSTADGFAALDASFASQPTLNRPGVRAGLGDVLVTEAAQRRTAETTLVVAAVGVLGVVLTALVQLLVISFARRRSWLTVARARGASRRQLVVAVMAETAGVAVVAAVLGAGAAAVVVRGEATALERVLLLGIVAGTILAGVGVAVSEGFRPVTVSGRPETHPGFGRWGRVAGGVLVVVAVAALVTFRRRGLATDSPDVDALVVLLPVVVPLAVADASRWLLPLVLRRVTGRGMALGPGRLVGLRRVVASPEAATGVVSALVLALTVAALGTAVDRSLEAGAVDASWRDVGAPYVIDTREPEVRDAVLTAVPEATVAAAGSTRVNVGRGESNYSVQLETLDVLADAAITDGTAADLGLPDELAALDEDGRVPVVAADRIGGRPVAPGDVLAGLGASGSPGYVVVDTRPEGFGRTRDWIVADRSTLAAVTGREPSFSELSIDAPDDARGTIEAIAVDAGERFAARADELDELLDDPLSRAVRLGYLLAAGGALVFALVAMTAVGVVTARQRRRQVAILGLLGAGRRELGRAVAAELVPAVVAGVVLGAAVGWSVVVLYDGRYDLSSFAGGSPSSIAPDPVAFAVLAAATAVVSVALVTNVVRRIVRAGVSEVLRLDGAA